jgi:hypothetical protein
MSHFVTLVTGSHTCHTNVTPMSQLCHTGACNCLIFQDLIFKAKFPYIYIYSYIQFKEKKEPKKRNLLNILFEALAC